MILPNQTIIRHARQVILELDVSKLDRPAPVLVDDFGDIRYLVTDDADPRPAVACEDASVTIVPASGRD